MTGVTIWHPPSTDLQDISHNNLTISRPPKLLPQIPDHLLKQIWPAGLWVVDPNSSTTTELEKKLTGWLTGLEPAGFGQKNISCSNTKGWVIELPQAPAQLPSIQAAWYLPSHSLIFSSTNNSPFARSWFCQKRMKNTRVGQLQSAQGQSPSASDGPE